MRRNRKRTVILSLILVLLSACAAPGNGGMAEQESGSALPEEQPFSASPETMPEETVSNIKPGTVTGSGGESNRTEPNPDQAVGTQGTLPEKDFRIDGEMETSEEKSAPEQETSLAAYRKTVEESDAGMVFL